MCVCMWESPTAQGQGWGEEVKTAGRPQRQWPRSISLPTNHDVVTRQRMAAEDPPCQHRKGGKDRKQKKEIAQQRPEL